MQIAEGEHQVEHSEELSLYDLVRPLIKYWKIVVWGSGASLAIALAFFVFIPRTYAARVDFSMMPIDFQTYSTIIGQLQNRDMHDNFFTKARLGIEPKSYFVPKEISKDTVTALGYIELSYPSPYIGKDGVDLFKGYFDSTKKLVQNPQSDFFFSFETQDGNREEAEKIAVAISSHYLPVSWEKAKLDRAVFAMQLANLTPDINMASYERELERLRGTISQLEQFQREYPSLIRSNLTLNDQMVPVEVQLMNVRNRVKAINDTMDDYYINQARFFAYLRFSEAYRMLSLSSADPAAFIEYRKNLTAVIEKAFVIDASLQKKMPPPMNLQAYLDREKATIYDSIERSTVMATQDLPNQYFEFKALPRVMKTVALGAFLGIVLSMVFAYTAYAAHVIKRRITHEPQEVD